MHSETPAAIESRALGTLAYIRASIESSSSMDVPGMAGIVMGIIGVLAAVAVSLPRLAPHWLAIWLIAAALALLLGGALVARQLVRRGHSRYLGPARRFLLCLCPALLAGAVLTMVLESAGTTGLIPGMWLLLYGCAVLSASTVTTRGDCAFDLHHGRAVRRPRPDRICTARDIAYGDAGPGIRPAAHYFRHPDRAGE